MGLSHKSKRSDKETQSPVLKIFKDIMQKEKREPELTNLLATKVERKRNHKKWKSSKSSSKPKYDQMVINSSTHSEDQGPIIRGGPEMDEYEIDRQNNFYDQKKDNYTFWTAEKPMTRKSEDTYSRVSCALKRIFTSDYACIVCLGLLFALSMLVAFCLVYKSIPCLQASKEYRRVEARAGDHNRRNFLMRKRDEGDSSHGVPESMEFGADLTSLVDSGSELSRILDSEKVNEIQSSERLREFYRKLIDADTQIQHLKQSSDSEIIGTGDYKTFPERTKRSLNILKTPMKLFHFKMNKKKPKDKLKKGKLPNNKNKTKGKISKEPNVKPQELSRTKRYDDDGKSYVIERKNILIQYKPLRSDTSRKSKCSHAPKDSKSHEHELKHPFYQNTQRLDELLDKLLFGIDTIDTTVEKDTNNCKHPKVDDIIKENHPKANTKDNDVKNRNDKPKLKAIEHHNSLTPIQTSSSSAILGDLESIDAELKRDDSSTNTYDIMMGITTNLYDTSILKRTNSMLERVPNIRRLLQADLDESQDMPEESVDPKDSDDNKDSEHDKEVERKKRMYYETNSENKRLTNPANVGQNWISPMPQEEYPHELSPMINDMRTIVNTIETPAQKENININKAFRNRNEPGPSEINIKLDEDLMNSKDSPLELDEFETDLTDMEYIEDYFHKKYKRLDGLAQAYSDYGVLEGKSAVTEKNVNKEKPAAGTEHKVSLSLNSVKEGLKNSIFGRPKKGDSLGKRSPFDFRFEIRPSTSGDDSMDIFKSIRNHIKIGNFKPSDNLPISTPVYMDTPPAGNKRKVKKSDTIMINKGRSLKTVNFEDDYEYKDDRDTDTFQAGRFDLKNFLNSLRIFFKREVNTDDKADNDDVTNYFRTDEAVLKNHELGNITEYNLTYVGTKYKATEGKRLDYDNLNESDPTKDSAYETRFNLFNDANNTSNLNLKREVNVNNSEISQKVVTQSEIKIAPTVMAITTKPSNKEFNESNSNNTRNVSTNHTFKFDNSVLLGGSNDTGLSLSELFMVMSDWFLNMDAAENAKHSGIKKSRHLKEPQGLNETIEITFPVYDSDMIENIGHRSRVLLSVDNNNTQVDEKEITKVNESVDKSTDIANISTMNENKTKNVVKRNAEDSNLIYWNDIYDDEYGVAVDQFQNDDKHKKNNLNNLVNTGNKWFKNKVHMISNQFHNKANSFRKEFGDVVNDKKDKIKGKASKVAHKYTGEIEKRAARSISDTGKQKVSMKTNFAALTRKMKDVCRKAAQDVRQAKKIHAREETKDDQGASSLMKQLVYLMGDVVDYQVQQRTCRKLPPDLQNYLEWLTSGVEHTIDDLSSIDARKSNGGHTDESKTDVFGILQTVQDLVKQYELMTEDEKSKMIGVRDYLDRQIQYIQDQMSSIDDYGLYDAEEFRFRRDTDPNKIHKQNGEKKESSKQKPPENAKKDHNQIKNEQHKNVGSENDKKAEHNNDKVHNTDAKKHNNKVDDNKKDSKTNRDKRNLRDIYYKAVKDAKEITTLKQ